MKPQGRLMRLPEREKDLLKKALAHKAQGDYESALAVLKPIASRHPNIAGVLGLIGLLCNQLGRFEGAERYLSQAVSINPKSELANRSLFHAIWEQGRQAEAIRVLQTYTDLTGSTEFEEILANYNEENGGSS